MKLEKKVVIEESDVSELHAELTGALDFLAEGMNTLARRDFLLQEFPSMTRLHRLLEGQVITEPGARVYDRLGGGEVAERKKRRERFLIVKGGEPTS